jgi:hypothetical protein
MSPDVNDAGARNVTFDSSAAAYAKPPAVSSTAASTCS